MKSTGIIRHLDELGRVAIPRDIRQSLNMKEGDLLEIYVENDGSIVLKPHKKSWEDTVIEWWEKNQNRPAIKRSTFTRIGDYTFCVLCKPDGDSAAGFAKRRFGDKEDERIGKVAAFARAIGRPIDEIIDWRGK
jgi:transcriptional pleiotropic regulator of transition state genes